MQYSGPGRQRGNHEGADTLVHDLFALGEELALDFTVVSDRAACRVVPAATPYVGSDAQFAATLAGAEDAKIKRYGAMYERIGVKVKGVAMDLAGDLGPGLRSIIRRCEVLAGSQCPAWANWASRGSSFFSAWRQRIIVAVQASNADCALAMGAQWGC